VISLLIIEAEPHAETEKDPRFNVSP